MPDTLGYARVSTDDQDLAGQVLRLKAAGAARTYEDVISGRTFDCPGLKGCWTMPVPATRSPSCASTGSDAHSRAAGGGRDPEGATDRTRFARREIDTTSAAGELVFHVFGAIAQFERRLIAKRTRDGVAAARAEGRHPGRPKLDQEKLHAALTLIRNGMSPTKAARHIGLPINPLPRACTHPRRTARSGLAGIMGQRTSEPHFG